ncbi:hypothetical protein PSQ40_04700 [Curvibacter sp. HBC61]|uniref:Uncharacterized protein n=1 Tax=Curvibacter cyanobacteriorum TaxID=3026422 RepID=A0ABT5MX05_9BURK|nr:hypothetical protein [Curvibacter sp. HBC61]MDD0837864.1 hypothetical protein [Curvibacter sp. HBC61]
MSTEREFNNAKRDFDRQVGEVRKSWLGELWAAILGLFKDWPAYDSTSLKKQRRDEVRRKAKDAL